jgi:hypothetical protein
MKICTPYHSLSALSFINMLIIYEEWPGIPTLFWNWRGVYVATIIKHVFATKSGYNHYRCGDYICGMLKAPRYNARHDTRCASAQHALRHLFPTHQQYTAEKEEWCINMAECDSCQIKLLLRNIE